MNKNYRVIVTLTQIEDIEAESLKQAKERANELVDELPIEDYMEDIKVIELKKKLKSGEFK